MLRLHRLDVNGSPYLYISTTVWSPRKPGSENISVGAVAVVLVNFLLARKIRSDT